jgi:tetratricopeptide (TPR) repeat protein
LHPEFALAYPYIGLNCALLGESEPAREAARRGIERLPDDHETLALGAAVFGLTGSEQEGQDAFDRLVAIGSRHYLDPWAVGAACAGLGNLDTAAHWFRRMYDERSPSAFCVRHDPLLDPLHEHPVFRDVLRRLAFPPLTSSIR